MKKKEIIMLLLFNYKYIIYIFGLFALSIISFISGDISLNKENSSLFFKEVWIFEEYQISLSDLIMINTLLFGIIISIDIHYYDQIEPKYGDSQIKVMSKHKIKGNLKYKIDYYKEVLEEIKESQSSNEELDNEISDVALLLKQLLDEYHKRLSVIVSMVIIIFLNIFTILYWIRFENTICAALVYSTCIGDSVYLVLSVFRQVELWINNLKNTAVEDE